MVVKRYSFNVIPIFNPFETKFHFFQVLIHKSHIRHTIYL